MANLQESINKAVTESLIALLNPGQSTPFKINDRFVKPTEPRNEDLPALFYGYGRAFENNNLNIPSVNDRGETLELSLYVLIFEDLTLADTTPYTRENREWWINTRIFDQSAMIHSLIQSWVTRNQAIGPVNVLKTRLKTLDTFEGKLGLREMLQIVVAIDYYYSLYHPENNLI